MNYAQQLSDLKYQQHLANINRPRRLARQQLNEFTQLKCEVDSKISALKRQQIDVDQQRRERFEQKRQRHQVMRKILDQMQKILHIPEEQKARTNIHHMYFLLEQDFQRLMAVDEKERHQHRKQSPATAEYFRF